VGGNSRILPAGPISRHCILQGPGPQSLKGHRDETYLGIAEVGGGGGALMAEVQCEVTICTKSNEDVECG
jgi:hypothetical protein